MSDKKKVVYLIGAGATQAELDLQYPTIRVLNEDIKDGIYSVLADEKEEEIASLVNELSQEKVDVEQLITLFEFTGIKKHRIFSEKLKDLYQKEINDRLSKIDPSKEKRKDYVFPKLLSALIDMHDIPDLKEKLCGFVTTNYDNLIEKASKIAKGGINYDITIDYDNCKQFKYKSRLFPIIKLHGSFNWKNGYPIKVVDDSEINNIDDVLWIPPGVGKKTERYPFGNLWGKGRDLLDCDILRVIGCSMSRNDWGLISLLFTSQKVVPNDNCFEIELINYLTPCKELKSQYIHLSIKDIFSQDYFVNFLKNLHSIKDKDLIAKYYDNPKDINIFDVWLKSKGESLINNDIDISTKKNLFSDYIKGYRNVN
ncbi:SIR2 family protein [candidate division KSB1 bacterium]